MSEVDRYLLQVISFFLNYDSFILQRLNLLLLCLYLGLKCLDVSNFCLKIALEGLKLHICESFGRRRLLVHFIKHVLQLIDFILMILDLQVLLFDSFGHLLFSFLCCLEQRHFAQSLLELFPFGIVDFLQFLTAALEMLDFFDYLIEVFVPRRHLRLYHRLLHRNLGCIGWNLDPLHLKEQFLLDLLETRDLPLHRLNLFADDLPLLAGLLERKLLILELLQPLTDLSFLLMNQLPVVLQALTIVCDFRCFLLFFLLLFLIIWGSSC